MLNQEIVHKIEEFVCIQPRSVLEISEHLKKNWRTTARYVEEIETQFGTLKTKTFRGGTRGALKIVYWNLNEKISKNVFQQELEQQILNSRKKEDFSAFDIFQYVEEKHKSLVIEKSFETGNDNLNDMQSLIKSVKKQLIVFSGNLSWINLKNKKTNSFSFIDELVKKGVKIKVICDVNLSGIKNIEKLISLNFKHNCELIEIKHRKQPLRGMISDNGQFRINEVAEATGKIEELNKGFFIFYTIKDKEWSEWLTKIFYKMFNTGTDVTLRMKELNKVFLENKPYKQHKE